MRIKFGEIVVEWSQAPYPRCNDPGILDEEGVWCDNTHCKVNQFDTLPYQHPPGCDCDDEYCEELRESSNKA